MVALVDGRPDHLAGALNNRRYVSLYALGANVMRNRCDRCHPALLRRCKIYPMNKLG